MVSSIQPAIYVTSLAAVEILRAREGGQQIIDSVDVTCGLSLGEYTALAFAGAFRFVKYLSREQIRFSFYHLCFLLSPPISFPSLFLSPYS